MKMYVWNSSVMEDYTSGIAVGVADTIDEAKAAILKWAHDVFLAAEPINDEWWEAYREREIESLTRSLAAEPDEVMDLPCGVVHSGGG